jgi:hypothetical protein
MSSKVFPFATVITAWLVISAANLAFAQAQESKFPSEWVTNANRILNSKFAKYLSGSGMNALNLISGRVQPVNAKASSPGASEPPGGRSGVMVNDPAHDVV